MFTGRVDGPCSRVVWTGARPVIAGIIIDTRVRGRVDGLCSRAVWTDARPVNTGVMLDTRVHGPCRRSVFTGSVDRRP